MSQFRSPSLAKDRQFINPGQFNQPNNQNVVYTQTNHHDNLKFLPSPNLKNIIQTQPTNNEGANYKSYVNNVKIDLMKVNQPSNQSTTPVATSQQTSLPSSSHDKNHPAVLSNVSSPKNVYPNDQNVPQQVNNNIFRNSMDNKILADKLSQNETDSIVDSIKQQIVFSVNEDFKCKFCNNCSLSEQSPLNRFYENYQINDLKTTEEKRKAVHSVIFNHPKNK